MREGAQMALAAVLVMPAPAGMQAVPPALDPGVRRDDIFSGQPYTRQSVQHA